MSDKLKVGVVGLGIWGKVHPLVYANYHKSEVGIVCDLNEKLAREMGERYHCDWTTNVDDVVNSDVDAVSVSTPGFTHFDIAKKVIAAGKHLFMEKPFTTTLEHAKILTKAAKEKGIFTMLDFHNRWNPPNMMTKEAVESGRLGKPVMGYARLSDCIQVPRNWLSWTSKSGPQWFLFPHTMDLMRWFIDEDPISVYAIASKEILKSEGIDTFDGIQAMMKFPSCVVTFESSWIVPDSNPNIIDCHMSLYGSKGKVEYNQDNPHFEIAADRFYYPIQDISVPNRYGSYSSWFYEPMRHFVDCVLEGRQPTCPFDDGVVNVAMIEATLKSIESGQPESITDLLK